MASKVVLDEGTCSFPARFVTALFMESVASFLYRRYSNKLTVYIVYSNKVFSPSLSLIDTLPIDTQKVHPSHLTNHNIYAGMPGQLSDFDWSLRLALSSDKLSNLRRERVLLKLVLTDTTSLDHPVIELDPAELASLLKRLKEAQAAVQNLRK